MTVSCLLRISLTVSDITQAAAFYSGTFGFSPDAGPVAIDEAWLHAMGARDTSAQGMTLRLGQQELELVAFDPPGQPYPADSASNDPWFQHIAIVVSDMPAAWDRVRKAGITQISQGGPQRLPPNTGSVAAVKFRDPEGHPLELLHFPPGTGDPAWQGGAKDTLFLGYDHSAIVVRDPGASVRFYTALGFSELSRSTNRGDEQQRLDGLPGDVVDVIALRPPAETTPHLELLAYRTPPVRAAVLGRSVSDIAATRVILAAEDLEATLARLRSMDAAMVPATATKLPSGGKAVLAQDPDGHRLVLMQQP